MKLFVGLGNPGEKYSHHRHNVGFMAVDTLVRRHKFSPWREKYNGLYAEGTIDGEKVVALKPQTYINESGQSAGQLARFYKIDPRDMVVFYDELDLPPMKVKTKVGGGAAGHNGIRSLIAHMGADFLRVRIGIGHPGSRELVVPYVLGNFSKAEEDSLHVLLDAVADQAQHLANLDGARFTTSLAQQLAPKKAPAKMGPGAQNTHTAQPASTQQAGARPADKSAHKSFDKKPQEGPLADALRALKGDK